MDFYKAQDDARRNTGRLVALFLGAVLTLVLLTNALVAAVFVVSTDTSMVAGRGLFAALATVPPETWAMVTFGVVGVIALACAYKFLELRGGGAAIAEALGGRQLSPNTDDAAQKRLLNVVEEMALASGIPVPPVYLVPEPSINAFAAGFGTGDAVLGINQGTVDNLSRDELQGVVAHEFSHLLHGDTKINLRLIALLHGILFVGLLGRLLLRGSTHSRGSRRGSNSGAPIVLLAIGLLVIGYGGTFFGNLIKAAVSRQREYLADGSAVQFTRNPDGIAGALKKIGGSALGSTMAHPRAAQASHMLFGQGMEHFLGSIMATHPPLPDRIRAINPDWDGKFVIPEKLSVSASDAASRVAPTRSGAATTRSGGAVDAGASDALEISDGPAGFAASSFDVIEQRVAESPNLVGNPNDDAHDAAQAVIATTASQLLTAAHEPFGARALCYALLLSTDDNIRKAQLTQVARSDSRRLVDQTLSLYVLADSADALHRLSLVQAAMPALKTASLLQHRSFLRTVTALIRADARIKLFEWVMHRVLIKDLGPHFERPKPAPFRHRKLETLREECQELISALARNGNHLASVQSAAFDTGMQSFGFSGRFRTEPDPNYARLSQALNRLRTISPLAKPRIIKACASTVLADELVTVAEGALLQGIAASLDCPLPPAIYDHLRQRSNNPTEG